MNEDIKVTRLSSKSQITIPAWARRQLRLEPGDRLILRTEDDRIVLERVAAPVRALRGRLRGVYGDAAAHVRSEREEWDNP